MPTETDQIKPLNVKEILALSDNYKIPIYQRNYAWGEGEIGQLIQDVIDFSRYYPDKNYYIGTLVVAQDNKEDHHYFSTIDGQQRLTTLSILTAVIKNEFKDVDVSWFQGINLCYSSRTRATNSLDAVFKNVPHPKLFEPSIFSAYNICKEELQKKTADSKISIAQFATYLYRYVIILRVPLPEGTDLNHYFEIMNSRGEQLEKYEVLKAALMKCFNSFEQAERQKYEACFNLVWEASSNMERYVQYGFTPDCRHLIFGREDWNTLSVDDFDELVYKITPVLAEGKEGVSLSIDGIIEGQASTARKVEKVDSPDKFNTVINFPNFLLHVLRVQSKNKGVALDDKRLLPIFETLLPKDGQERIKFVKSFIFNLLKCKMLFDKYVIKREFTGNTDRWSLRSLKWYNSVSNKNAIRYGNTFGDEGGDSFDSENRRVIMLLSMFHTILPAMAYKYWLNAAINYLFNQTIVEGKHYISYLEHIAKSFVFDNYLAVTPKGYDEMICENLRPVKRDIKDIDLNKLTYGLTNNLVFNLLDYLLWSGLKDTEADQRVKKFEFTSRSSVEHYYPQTPINKDLVIIDDADLHSFGNLCLISHEKNSRLNNLTPAAKKDFYNTDDPIDTLKQFLMMKFPHWTYSEIREHNTRMTTLLLEHLDSDFNIGSEISIAQQWYDYYRGRDPQLLVRALLCFGDCSRHTGGDKYNLLDFKYMHGQAAFADLDAYVSECSPASLSEVIKNQLDQEDLKFSFRYLFIKYPELLAYCKGGNFLWYDAHDGKLIYLLSSQKKTEYKSKELYCYLIERYILKTFGINAYGNAGGIYLRIGFKNEAYHLTGQESERAMELCIKNDGGVRMCCNVKPFVNGNQKAIKSLTDYQWVKNSEGRFERNGTSGLFKLSDNNEKNAAGVIAAVNRILKDGFGIKI